MWTEWIFLLIFLYSLGILCGFLFCKSLYKPSGTFKIDRSNPKKDIYRIELDGDPIELIGKEYIVLKVDSKADLQVEEVISHD